MNNLITHNLQVSKKSAGLRLDKFIAVSLPELSRSMVKKLIESSNVFKNNKPITACSVEVKEGDAFTINIPPASPSAMLPANIPLKIVYEDNEFLIIDKQAVKNAVIEAAIVAGFAALTGFAIYALVKTSNNNSNRNYYPASAYQQATLGGPVNPNYHQVRGHRWKNQWIDPYNQTDADGNPLNNYSTSGNVNPWHR